MSASEMLIPPAMVDDSGLFKGGIYWSGGTVWNDEMIVWCRDHLTEVPSIRAVWLRYDPSLYRGTKTPPPLTFVAIFEVEADFLHFKLTWADELIA